MTLKLKARAVAAVVFELRDVRMILYQQLERADAFEQTRRSLIVPADSY